jgi:hypothetical protein
MPLFQYFAWVGSFLLATLLAANWCLPATMALQAGVPLDQKIKIRIHTDHKWPERVVFDTAGAKVAQKANVETAIDGSEPSIAAERQTFDAFAEMAGIRSGRVFDRPARAARLNGRRTRVLEKPRHLNFARALAARKDPTLPSRPGKPPGRS